MATAPVSAPGCAAAPACAAARPARCLPAGQRRLAAFLTRLGRSAPARCACAVSHMPPELVMSGKLSPLTDVYSLGVLMWVSECTPI